MVLSKKSILEDKKKVISIIMIDNCLRTIVLFAIANFSSGFKLFS